MKKLCPSVVKKVFNILIMFHSLYLRVFRFSSNNIRYKKRERIMCFEEEMKYTPSIENIHQANNHP